MTVAAGKTLKQGATYQVEPTTGSYYEDTWRFAPESLVGLQAQAVITDKLRATVQLVAKGGDEYDANVDWAFMSYDLTNDLTLNAGRFRLPLYYYSDFLDVGYAYHWIRPPVEMYDAFTAGLEGVNLYHNTFLGNWQLETQAWYGGIQAESDMMSFDVQGNAGVAITGTWNWLKLRALYNVTEIGLESDYFDMDVDVKFMALGLMVDHNNFFWRNEATLANNRTHFPETNDAPAGTLKTETLKGYSTVGYTFGNWTPHFTQSYTREDANGHQPDATTSTVGVAWNFHRSAMFKLEYMKTRVGDSEVFNPVDFSSMTIPGPKFGMISTAINILF